MTFEVVIPHWHPPSLNKLLNCHWAQRNRMKQATAQMIGAYCHQAKVTRATGKRNVVIELVLGKGQRALDPDNVPKAVLDSLKNLGYIRDDSRTWLELSPVKFSRSEKKATILRITDLAA